MSLFWDIPAFLLMVSGLGLAVQSPARSWRLAPGGLASSPLPAPRFPRVFESVIPFPLLGLLPARISGHMPIFPGSWKPQERMDGSGPHHSFPFPEHLGCNRGPDPIYLFHLFHLRPIPELGMRAGQVPVTGR